MKCATKWLTNYFAEVMTMRPWLIVVLYVLVLLYFTFNVSYILQWIRAVLSGMPLSRRPGWLYIIFLLFFALPSVLTLIAFSFAMPHLERRWPLRSFFARRTQDKMKLPRGWKPPAE